MRACRYRSMTWKIYLRWHLIHHAAPALSSKFVDENFDFYGKTLTGTKEIFRAGGAACNPPTAISAKSSGSFTCSVRFRPKRKLRRSRWFTT